jgi:phage-related protein
MKPLMWVGTTLEDLRTFPDAVKRVMGYALHLAQAGSKHPDAKPRRGFTGASVLEIRDDYRGDTFRVVYTVGLRSAVYVLHAFQKKAKRGIETPRRDIELIRVRLLRSEELDMRRRAGES